MKKISNLILLMFAMSCSSYNVTVSNSEKDDERYSKVFHNKDYHVNLHSYGGRHLEKRTFHSQKGKLILSYSQQLRKEKDLRKGKNAFYSLFIVKEIPLKAIQRNDTVTVPLYQAKVKCFKENDRSGAKKIYKRYFTVNHTNYLFLGKFKQFYKDTHETYEFHLSQEMAGLEP